MAKDQDPATHVPAESQISSQIPLEAVVYFRFQPEVLQFWEGQITLDEGGSEKYAHMFSACAIFASQKFSGRVSLRER